MAGVTITLDGQKRLKEALRSAAARSTHLRPAFLQAGEVMKRSIDHTFRAQGRPKQWEPLSEATIYERLGGAKAYTKGGRSKGRMRAPAVRKRGLLRILHRIGDLQGSVTYKPGDTYLELGSIKVYAAIHQYGGTAGRKSAPVQIPARPYIVVLPEDEADIARILDHYVTEPLTDVG